MKNDDLHNEIMKWGNSYLTSHGYTLESELPENVLNTPWSDVVRFVTSTGHIYLKHTPPLLALEANIIQKLRTQFHAPVPEVIALNAELNSFLMKDAGKSLRGMLKQQFDTTLFCKVIDLFTLMQLSVSDHIDIFLDMGVPDWRLEKLPDLYRQLLSEKEILIADGLSEIEIGQLEELIPKVSDLCQKLSSYAIKPSIVQPDFSDNNTLIANVSRDITIVDLGEISISHPFFSLINCLEQAQKHYALTDKDDIYQLLMEASLKNYMIFESKKNLLEAFALANILIFIYGALSDYRLMMACDKAKLSSFFVRHGRPSIPLKEFISVCRELK